MKKQLLIFVVIICFGNVMAQSLTPQVIASSGNSFSNATGKLDFTIGEVVISTLSVGGNILTQGFHQPEIKFSSIEDHHPDFAFTLYPNPTEQFVTVESSQPDDLQVCVFDAAGGAILVSPVFQQKITIDLYLLAAGSYIFRITNKSGIPLHSYTLIKKSIN